MYATIIILIIVLSFVLIFAILAQNSKGGVGSQFGGSGASQVMGVKRTGDFLERATWTLGAAILVLTLLTNAMVDKGTSTQENVNAARTQQAIPGGATPDMGIDAGNDDASQEDLLNELSGDSAQ